MANINKIFSHPIVRINTILKLRYASTATKSISDEYIKVDDNFENNFIRKITMINEKQRNSLGIDMIRSLQKGIDSIDLDKCRVLVLNSSSPKVFSAGNFEKRILIIISRVKWVVFLRSQFEGVHTRSRY